MADDKEIGLVVRGKDAASPVFQRIGASGTRNLNLVREMSERASLSLKQMPRHFSASAGAMMLMGSATSQMGGGVAAALGKMSALGSLITTGPLGIGIAALTVAVGAGAAVWDIYNSRTRAAEAASTSLARAMTEMDKRIDEQRQSVIELGNAIRYWGMSSLEVEAAKIREGISAREAAIAANEAQAQSMIESANAIQAQAEALERYKGSRTEVTRLEGEAQALARQANELYAGTQRAMDALGTDRQRLALMGEQLNRLDAEGFAKWEKQKTAEAKQQAAERERIAKKEADEKTKLAEQAARRFVAAWSHGTSAIAGGQATYYTNLADMQERAAKHFEAQQEEERRRFEEAEQEKQRLAAQTASAIADGIGGAFVALALGGEDAGKQIALSLTSAAQQAISAYAASSAAATFFSQAGIPVIGPILATAASATAFALVRGFLTKFATGGVVGGGVPGVDRNIIAVTRKERVLTERQNVAFERIAGVSGGGGGAGARAAGPSVTFAPRIEMLSELSPEETRKMLLRLNTQMEQLVADGLILRGLARG